MLLKGKNAVIYGVGDSLGGAVAKAFAEAGARVFLTARRRANAEKVAHEIRASGGRAEVDEVDALVEEAVKAHVARVVDQAGTLDISFNLINIQDRQDTPLIEMKADDFVRPVRTAMLTQFLTGTAAACVMSGQRSGVILSLTATPGGIGYPLVGGFGPACCAIEAFSRNLAAELGPAGVRVVNLRSAGSPDSRPFREAIDQGGAEVKEFFDKIQADTMLKKLPLMKDVANAATFLASDFADKITGVTVDITAGTTGALNYKVPTIAFVKK
jgi:NAD(P)-dependent dehydrogenase (short-subunit alcohol dehydrogenase family)